jgi:hypothetical protein
VIQVVQKYGESLDRAISDIIGSRKVRFAGIVLTLNFASVSSEPELAGEVARLFFQPKAASRHIVSASAALDFEATGILTQ